MTAAPSYRVAVDYVHARPRGRIRRAAGSVVWCAGLAVLAHVLWLLGRGPLAPPPVSDWTEVERWLHERTPVTAAFALLRIVALVVVAYLLVLTLLALCAHLLHLPHLLRAVELSSVPAARRMISTVAGLGLGASTTLVAVTPGVGAPARPPAATAHAYPDTTPWPSPRLVIEQVHLAPIVLEEVPALTESPSPARRPATVRVTAHPPPPQPPSPPTAQPAATWIVSPGDHLWSIAATHLGSVRRRPVTDAEIDPYWRAVVETNRAALPDPSNPDLLFAGATILLPPVPPDPDAPDPLSIARSGPVSPPRVGPATGVAASPPPPPGGREPAPSAVAMSPAERRADSSAPGASPHPTRHRRPMVHEDGAPLDGAGPTMRPDSAGPTTPMVRHDPADPEAADPTIRPRGASPPDSARQTDGAPTMRRDDRAPDRTVEPTRTRGPSDRNHLTSARGRTERVAPADPPRPAEPSDDPPVVRPATDPDLDHPIVLEEIPADHDHDD